MAVRDIADPCDKDGMIPYFHRTLSIRQSFEKSPLLQRRHASLDQASIIFGYSLDSGSSPE